MRGLFSQPQTVRFSTSQTYIELTLFISNVYCTPTTCLITMNLVSYFSREKE